MSFQKADDPVWNETNKYKCHSSIVMIKSKIEAESIVSFTPAQFGTTWRYS